MTLYEWLIGGSLTLAFVVMALAGLVVYAQRQPYVPPPQALADEAERERARAERPRPSA